jgi:hypothetical protein
LKVIDADLVRERDRVVIDVLAYAPTLGWKDVTLSRVEYIQPPEDGIQDFVLSGTPPSGVAPTAIETYALSGEMPDAPWVQGARVQDSTGESLVLRTAVKGSEPVGGDMVAIKSAGRKNPDKLIIDVRYGGGCGRHTFQLAWDGAVLKSDPPQVSLVLSHDANGDMCRALLSERLQFDLSTILDNPNDYVLLVTSGTSEVVVPARGG